MNPLFIIFIGLPIIEIVLMIKIGQLIGAINTVLLIFLTAATGIFFARIQGLKTLKSGLTNMYKNQIPINELISGASIAFAAILLIIPGFFTDFIGFLLLIPFTRNILLNFFKKRRMEKKIDGEENIIEAEVIDENEKNEEK
tara:strand:+ start:802 stop:1227 length:426 start_codon:yes stop_codon:yes gene_type:complete